MVSPAVISPFTPAYLTRFALAQSRAVPGPWRLPHLRMDRRASPTGVTRFPRNETQNGCVYEGASLTQFGVDVRRERRLRPDAAVRKKRAMDAAIAAWSIVAKKVKGQRKSRDLRAPEVA